MNTSAPFLFGRFLLAMDQGVLASLLASGLVLTFRKSSFVSFRQGGYFLLGGLGTWAGREYLGLNYWEALLLVPPVIGILGVQLDRQIVPLLGIPPGEFPNRLAASGLGLLLAAEALVRFQTGYVGLPVPVPAELTGGTLLGLVFLPYYRIWIVLAATACTLAAAAATATGKTTDDNPSINVAGAAAGLAAIGGVLAAPIYTVNAGSAVPVLEVALAAAIVSGMRSLPFATAAGILISMLQSAFTIFAPDLAPLVPAGCLAIFLLKFGGHERKRPEVSRRIMHDSVRLYLNGSSSRIFSPNLSILIMLTGALIIVVQMKAVPILPPLVMGVVIYSVPAASIGLLMRRHGLLSFGHAALFGAGSYTCASLLRAGMEFPVALLAAGIVAGALGGVFGMITSRARPALCPAITSSLSQLVYYLVLVIPEFGREDGISGFSRGDLLGRSWLSSDTVFLTVSVLACCAVQISLEKSLQFQHRTPHVYAPDSILQSFALSGLATGLAGGLSASFHGIVFLNDLGYSSSAVYILVALAGLRFPFWGTVAAASVLSCIETYAAVSGFYFDAVVGLGLIFVSMTQPDAVRRHQPA